MQAVTISIPTKIISCVESYLKIPDEVRGQGGDAVFLVTDKGVAHTDFFRRVIDLLTSSKIRFDVFDIVESNPSDKTVGNDGSYWIHAYRGWQCPLYG